MSNDIVTRLLNEAQTLIYYEVKNENLLFDAVREIERLRTERDNLKIMYDQAVACLGAALLKSNHDNKGDEPSSSIIDEMYPPNRYHGD